jgi:hypothetical protein
MVKAAPALDCQAMVRHIQHLLYVVLLACSYLVAQDTPTAHVIATIKETPFVAESVTFDARTNTYFLSSQNRRVILAVRDGQARTFVDPQAGSLSGTALDPASRTLWVCSNVSKLAKVYMRPDEKEHSEVLAIDIDTAQVRRTVTFQQPEQPHLCDSVAVDPSGNLYITDAGQNSICVLTKGAVTIRKCVETYGRVYPQGAVPINATKLLVAGYAAGIGELDLGAETWRKLRAPVEVDLRGIDGLSRYKRCLIGIQNGSKPAKVLLMHLTASKDAIDSVITVKTDPPELDEPTWGTVVGDRFVFIGNSQGETFLNKGPHALQPTMLLEFKLPASCAR